MTDNEIYKLWLSKSKDPRYLRPKRWAEMKKYTLEHKVKSVIEFGSGISTLLFSEMGLSVISYETDPRYMATIRRFRLPRVEFRKWDNQPFDPGLHFDMAFVDGILPRIPQLQTAITCTDLIALDDYGPRMKNILSPYLTDFRRLNPRSELMAVFSRQSKN